MASFPVSWSSAAFCVFICVTSSWIKAAPTVVTPDGVNHAEQCDVIMSAFEVFEARVIESSGDSYSQHLMDRLMENLGLGHQQSQHDIRHYLCRYVGVNSMNRLAAVHEMSKDTIKNYYQLLKSYWGFMRFELQEALNVDSDISDEGRESLTAYLALLTTIENTGFLDIES